MIDHCHIVQAELTSMLVTEVQIGQAFIVQHSKDMAKLS